MLRYYDEAGLLKAAEVDQWTGHRMYSVTQIPRLNRILYLRDSGFHVSEIALALEMDDCLLLKTLEQKQLEIEEKIRKIEAAKNELQGNKGELHYNISMKAIPEYQVLSLRRIVPTYYSEGDLWNELSAFAKKQNSHDVRYYTELTTKSRRYDMNNYQLKPIGKVKNDDRGALIELDPEYIPGLQAFPISLTIGNGMM